MMTDDNEPQMKFKEPLETLGMLAGVMAGAYAISRYADQWFESIEEEAGEMRERIQEETARMRKKTVTAENVDIEGVDTDGQPFEDTR